MIRAGKHPRRFLGAFFTLVLVNFIFAWAIFSTSYVNSSFLGTFFDAEMVSLIYVLASAANITMLFSLPFAIRALGVWPLVIIIIPVLQLSILLFGLAATAMVAGIFFLVRGASIVSLRYFLDLYVESITEDETKTGNMRSLYITGANIGVILGPITASILIFGDNYDALYSFSALMLAAVFLISLFQLHRYKPSIPDTGKFIESIKSLGTCLISVRRTMVVQLIYHMWNTWIIIYAPLYLVQSGYEWQFIGGLIAIALLPYLFLEIPLGILADKKWGEKEIMVVGVVVLALMTGLLSLVSIDSQIILWSLVFIAMRIGAAMVEVATESYFFKQVDEEDSALISMFRMLAPLGGLLGPLIALAIIPFTGLGYLFGVLGAIILVAIPFAARIHDTR